jgi:hypothetical protein
MSFSAACKATGAGGGAKIDHRHVGIQQEMNGLCEKGQFACEEPEKHLSAAKADVNFAGSMRGLKPPPPSDESFPAACEGPVDFARFVPGMNPRPTARRCFSAACKARTLFLCLYGPAKQAAEKQGTANEALAGAKARSFLCGIFGPAEAGP